jgi:hypothetical protein
VLRPWLSMPRHTVPGVLGGRCTRARGQRSTGAALRGIAARVVREGILGGR